MKKLLLTVLFLGALTMGKAQAFNGSGDQKLDLGICAFGYGTGVTGTYDYGLIDWLSIGAGADFYWGNNDHNGHDNTLFGYGRVNFHLGELLGMPKQMDLYPGVNIGILNSGFGVGGHLGFRYFFNDKFGAFAEIGSHGTLGVSINL